jgi:DNA-binding GntR family transcriptional regulator
MILKRVNAPIRDQTLKHLRGAIIGGQFKPGERLSERKLCELIGASRTTIREVLRHLESEGLIKAIPQKGPIVATISAEEAKHIYEVREVLEGFMCRLFAERSTSNAKTALLRSLELLEGYVQKEDLKNQLIESNKFYEILMEGCGNEFVCSLLKSLHARISFLRRMSLSSQGRPSRSAKELRAMYEAIGKGDADTAYEASTYHVREAKSSALQYLRSSCNGEPNP